MRTWIPCPSCAFPARSRLRSLGTTPFKKRDNIGLSRPCTKYNFLVRDVNDLAQTIKEAFYIASTGQAGPRVGGHSKDISMNKTDVTFSRLRVHSRI